MFRLQFGPWLPIGHNKILNEQGIWGIKPPYHDSMCTETGPNMALVFAVDRLVFDIILTMYYFLMEWKNQ